MVKLLTGLYLFCVSVPCMAAACVLVAIAMPGMPKEKEGKR